MVQPAQPGMGNQGRFRGRLLLDWPSIRRIFCQRIVDAVLMAVAGVLTHEPAEVLLVQRDDVVEDLSTATSHKALGDAVLPRCLDTGPLGFQPRCFQEFDYFGIELGVAVEDDVTIRGRLGKSFPQLLDHPLRRRMGSNIEMQDPPPSMLGDDEAVQQLERHRRHREEVEGGDTLAIAHRLKGGGLKPGDVS